MASVQLKQTFEGKSSTEVYEAALQAIPGTGFIVWKTRELAKLVLGKGSHLGQEVRCNVMVSMLDGSATVTAEGEELDEGQLAPLAEKILEELAHLLESSG